jgi:hypothetical protein
MENCHLLFPILVIIFQYSCGTSGFNKAYYEKVTGMEFPDNYKIIESEDNTETLSIATLQIDSLDLVNFIRKYNLDTLKMKFPPRLFGIKYLHGRKPDLNNKSVIYFVEGSSKTNKWLYIVDIKQKLLWAEVRYPDWSGNNP